jgi:hypothetical protein
MTAPSPSGSRGCRPTEAPRHRTIPARQALSSISSPAKKCDLPDPAPAVGHLVAGWGKQWGKDLGGLNFQDGQRFA